MIFIYVWGFWSHAMFVSPWETLPEARDCSGLTAARETFLARLWLASAKTRWLQRPLWQRKRQPRDSEKAEKPLKTVGVGTTSLGLRTEQVEDWTTTLAWHPPRLVSTLDWLDDFDEHHCSQQEILVEEDCSVPRRLTWAWLGWPSGLSEQPAPLGQMTSTDSRCWTALSSFGTTCHRSSRCLPGSASSGGETACWVRTHCRDLRRRHPQQRRSQRPRCGRQNDDDRTSRFHLRFRIRCRRPLSVRRSPFSRSRCPHESPWPPVSSAVSPVASSACVLFARLPSGSAHLARWVHPNKSEAERCELVVPGLSSCSPSCETLLDDFETKPVLMIEKKSHY